MPTIHPSATISKEADLAPDVHIGPGCVIEGRVTLGPGTRLYANCYLFGPVTIGENAQLYPGVCVGFPGQDVKFKPGMPTAGVVIGKNALLREHATVHAATNNDRATTIGDNVFMMVNAHVGHDCRVGNNVVLVNNTALGGFVTVGDAVILGGNSGVHQHGRVGRLAFIGGGAAISADVPPFCIAHRRNRLAGLNFVGLRRAGVPRDQITALRAAYRAAFRKALSRPERVAALNDAAAATPLAAELAAFIADAKRPIAEHFIEESSSGEGSDAHD